MSNWIRCEECRSLVDRDRAPFCYICHHLYPAEPRPAEGPPPAEMMMQKDARWGRWVLVAIGVLGLLGLAKLHALVPSLQESHVLIPAIVAVVIALVASRSGSSTLAGCGALLLIPVMVVVGIGIYFFVVCSNFHIH